MATEASKFNPYQAPSTPMSDASLASDTEFLFNDKVVAGTGTIVLPRVCVVTGSTDSLIANESRLWWCTRWITFTRTAMIVAALLFGIPMLMHLPSGTAGLSASTNFATWLQLIAGAGLILGAIALTTAYYVMRSSIQVHWFISRQMANRTFYVSLVNLVLSIGFSTVILLNAVDFGLAPLISMGPVILVGPGIWILGSVLQMIRGKRILYVADQKDGLFLIGGVSDKFLAETKRMADEFNARPKA